MKYLKILGLAAVAAAALMAFVGAGTASAETTLCKTTTTPCPSTGNYPVGTVIKGTSSNSKLVSAFLTDACTSSTVEGTLERATTPAGKITNLSWSGCTYPTTTATKGELIIHHDPNPETGTHNGQLTAIGVVVKIEGPATCYYGGEVKEGLTLKAGEKPQLIAEATVNLVSNETHKSSAFCSSTGKWTGTYAVTPAPMYVTTGV
jgi:hypothetical protein